MLKPVFLFLVVTIVIHYIAPEMSVLPKWDSFAADVSTSRELTAERISSPRGSHWRTSEPSALLAFLLRAAIVRCLRGPSPHRATILKTL